MLWFILLLINVITKINKEFSFIAFFCGQMCKLETLCKNETFDMKKKNCIAVFDTMDYSYKFEGLRAQTEYFILIDTNSETLNILAELAGQYLIYADVCLLDNDYMLKNSIIFKKIPRDIKRF